MVDYDSNGESKGDDQATIVAEKRKQVQEKRTEVQMGEGLGGLNFHPQITPGLIFDNSHSGTSNENESQNGYSSQSSGREAR